jgi:hypothetical protein
MKTRPSTIALALALALASCVTSQAYALDRSRTVYLKADSMFLR